jgi:hypothetical protein
MLVRGSSEESQPATKVGDDAKVDDTALMGP